LQQQKNCTKPVLALHQPLVFLNPQDEHLDFPSTALQVDLFAEQKSAEHGAAHHLKELLQAMPRTVDPVLEAATE
jgi:hypothetical protein